MEIEDEEEGWRNSSSKRLFLGVAPPSLLPPFSKAELEDIVASTFSA